MSTAQDLLDTNPERKEFINGTSAVAMGVNGYGVLQIITPEISQPVCLTHTDVALAYTFHTFSGLRFTGAKPLGDTGFTISSDTETNTFVVNDVQSGERVETTKESLAPHDLRNPLRGESINLIDLSELTGDEVLLVQIDSQNIALNCEAGSVNGFTRTKLG